MRSRAEKDVLVCLPVSCWFVSLCRFLCCSASAVVPSGYRLRDICVLCLVECTIFCNVYDLAI